MKIWILIFSAALFAGGTCLGVVLQPRLAPKPRAAARANLDLPWGDRHRPFFSVSRFASALDLSDEQDRELDAILGDSQDETQALGRALRAAQEKSRQRITEILTPEQRKRLDELMAAERQKRSESEIARTVDIYRKLLSLSEEQSAAMRAAYRDARDHRRDPKSPGDHPQARRPSREDLQKALEKVLSPDQYKQYLIVCELER